MRRLTIRPMTLGDVAPAVAFMRDGGWGEKGPVLRFALSHPQCRPFVAEVGGHVVGTASATTHGKTGWIGEVFVEPQSRRSGAGRALFEACVQHLETRGCVSLLLLATEMGRRIYERAGFRAGALVQQWRGPVVAGVPPTSTLRRATAGDVSAIAALLMHAHRARDDGSGTSDVAVPVENAAAHDHLTARGFRVAFEVVRMTKGPEVAWHPEMSWGAFGLGFG